MKQKVIVILGPTASGKSDLAVTIAKTFDGEIISADSRQVYKGLNIGTGKITKREMQGVAHHLLDVANPKSQFTASDFKDLGEDAIQQIISKNKIPIICGGTGFYIDTLLHRITLPDVPPNPNLRKRLKAKSVSSLFAMLKKLDPRRAKDLESQSQTTNIPRIIRAIEIARTIGRVPNLTENSKYDVLFIGTKWSDEDLKSRIHSRLLSRIKSGMINEAKKLHEKGLSWRRMDELGLEYRYLAQYLQNKITRNEMIEKLNTEIWHYAKRQITWFSRNKEIVWTDPKQIDSIQKRIKLFLNN